MAKERKKRKRKSKSSGTSGGGGQGGGGGRSGGGVLQGIRTGIRRATGVESKPVKSSKTSNIISAVILLGAIGFLLYRFYG